MFQVYNWVINKYDALLRVYGIHVCAYLLGGHLIRGVDLPSSLYSSSSLSFPLLHRHSSSLSLSLTLTLPSFLSPSLSLISFFLPLTLSLPLPPSLPFPSSPSLPHSSFLSQGTREELSSCEADLHSLNDTPHPLKVSSLSLEQQQQGSPHFHINTS